MKKKYWIIIGLVIVIVLLFFNFFSIVRIDTALSSKKTALVRKVHNPNRTFNLFLPKITDVIDVGDLIIHKEVIYADRKFSHLNNKTNRIMGGPGDTISIVNKIIYNNGNIISVGHNKLFFQYRVSFNFPCDCKKELNEFKFRYLETIADSLACEIITTPENANEILNLESVAAVRHVTELRGRNIKGYFPNNQFFAWNKDFMGPLFVPNSGSMVELNPRSIELYKRIIDVFEGNDLIYNLARILINGVKVDRYVFQGNYYFVVNDDRDMAKDSRYWGFVPEDYITGKVIL